MTSNSKSEITITQRGRNLLELIRANGSDGIMRKGLTDALRSQLEKEDYDQLDLLRAQGLITIEQVDLPDHPEVEYRYTAIENRG